MNADINLITDIKSIYDLKRDVNIAFLNNYFAKKLKVYVQISMITMGHHTSALSLIP